MSAILSLDFWTFVAITAGIYTVFALGLQVQFGVGGLMNFGHVASMAIAAYTMANLVVKHGVNMWLACLAGIAASMAAGLLVGLVTMRLRKDYFAIVTIAFSEIVRYVATNQPGLTGGPQGTIGLAGAGQTASFSDGWTSMLARIDGWLEPVLGERATRDVAMLLIVWSVAAVLLLAIGRLGKLPWARVLRAIREDDEVPAALGKNVVAYRLQAMIIGAAVAAVAGLLYAFQYSFFGPNDFEPLITFFAWMILILGGATRVRAVPVGAVIFAAIFAGTRFFDFFPFSLFESAERAYLRLIIVGVILIALMLVRPQGLLGRRDEMVLE